MMAARTVRFQEAKLSSQGQVTIPVEIRRALNLEAGSVIVFHLDENQRLTVKPKKRRPTVAELAGSVPARVKITEPFNQLFEETYFEEHKERIDTGIDW